ncbi:MAG: hypothetical protein EPN62_00185 [Candidimonas sp.]|nr:MAG: hypothetical protein EPN62_00185 [Candidimonas sp.]
MFIGPEEYKSCLRKLVAEEEALDIAVAFWGAGAYEYLYPDKTKPIRMICNLRTGGTNPVVIQQFLDQANRNNASMEIRQCDRLHAKVILGKHQALIGSANLSTNGLGIEVDDNETIERSALWLEAGIYTRDGDELTAMRNWFERLWQSKHVRLIGEEDIKDAKRAWERHRATRPDLSDPSNAPFSLATCDLSEIKDLPAYALLYRNELFSDEAKAALKAEQDSVDEQQGGQTKTSKLWAFEGWREFPKASVPVDFVSIYWRPRGGIRVDGVCRFLDLRNTFNYADDTKGYIDLAKPVQELLKRPFRKEDRKSMAELLNSCHCMSEIWEASDNDGEAGVIHLEDLARIVQRHMKKK